MKTSNFSFISETDGLELSALMVYPDTDSGDAPDIKGIVQLVHGMSEYKERYMPFMEFLAANGYITAIHDHRGHGKSVKSEEDFGYMYEGCSEGLLEDIHQFSSIIKEKSAAIAPDTQEKLPFILFGHSMGALLVRSYLKKYDGEIDKLIVCGNPSKIAGSGLGKLIIKIAELIKGGKEHLRLLDYLIIDMSFEGKFPGEGINSWINSDPEKVREYNEDKNCGFRFTINGYNGLLAHMVGSYKNDGWLMSNPELPIMFFSGEDDPCAINRKAWEASQNFMKNLGYTNVTGKMYPGMRHEILNEPRNATVYSDMIKFIEA